MSLEEARIVWLRCDHRDPPLPGLQRRERCPFLFGDADRFASTELHDLVDDARAAGWLVTETFGPEPTWAIAESFCPSHRGAALPDTTGGREP